MDLGALSSWLSLRRVLLDESRECWRHCPHRLVKTTVHIDRCLSSDGPRPNRRIVVILGGYRLFPGRFGVPLARFDDLRA